MTKIVQVDYDKLHLDEENPRLPSELLNGDPKKILNWIAKSTAIEDLMGPIAERGFFPAEPLVAVPKPNSTDEYIVVEGNRRLTAVKLLNEPGLLEKPSARFNDIVNSAKIVTKKIPVVAVKTRAEVLPYLGFRHITGVKQWEPLPKARYIKQLFDLTEISKPANVRYKEVATIIGSRRDHIKRSLDALAVYNVIERNSFFDIPDLTEESIKYAVLGTALADDRIASFVGVAKLDSESGEYEATDPILNSKELVPGHIKELTEWLFKKIDGKKAVVGESRRLRELAVVLTNAKSIAALRGGSSLSYAYRLSEGVDKDFENFLYDAQAALENATGVVASVTYSQDKMDVAKRIRESISLIGKTLDEKRRQLGDDTW